MSDPFLYPTTRQGAQVASFPNVCKTPAAPSPLPIPYPTMGTVSGGAGKHSVATVLALANAVDARAANGNRAAQAAQGSAIRNVGQNGGQAQSATQAVLLGQSTLDKSMGNEPGTMKDVATMATSGKSWPIPVPAVQIHFEGKPVTIMGGAGLVDFNDTPSAAAE